MPRQQSGNSQIQRSQHGHYQVVPPPQVTPNDGRSGHNPYEFIVNPTAKSKVGRALLSGDTFLKRIVMMVGGVLLLFIVGGILVTSLEPKGSIPGMIAIAQRQQEVVRVATNATSQASNQDAKNFVTNVEITITSSQKQTLAYLTAHRTKLSTKELTLDKDPQTDAELANAATANNYDGAVTQELVNELQTYEGLLQSTYGQSTSTETKQVLQTEFLNVTLLIKQGEAVETELGS